MRRVAKVLLVWTVVMVGLAPLVAKALLALWASKDPPDPWGNKALSERLEQPVNPDLLERQGRLDRLAHPALMGPQALKDSPAMRALRAQRDRKDHRVIPDPPAVRVLPAHPPRNSSALPGSPRAI